MFHNFIFNKKKNGLTKIIYRDWNERTKKKIPAEIKLVYNQWSVETNFLENIYTTVFPYMKQKKRKYFGAVLFMFLLWNGWKK